MNKVRSLLEEKGWSVTKLMRKSGLAMGTCHQAATVADWPTEGVNWGTIQAIASALDVSPVDLISENNKDP